MCTENGNLIDFLSLFRENWMRWLPIVKSIILTEKFTIETKGWGHNHPGNDPAVYWRITCEETKP